MDFALTVEQEQIRELVRRICAGFGDEYWLMRDREGGFPHEFHSAFARDRWLGVAMPQEFGGAGLGILEAAIMMETVAESGAGMSGASSIHMNIFGLNPVVVFGTTEQKQRMLPPLIEGRDKACFAVTEPDAGLNTTELRTRAVRRGERYVVSGQKIWISTAQVANKILLLARTTPLEAVKRKTEGLTLFYTDFDRAKIEVREIPKMGRHAVDSNMLFIEKLDDSGDRPHRRRRRGVQVHPARHESRAHPHRLRGGRHRPRGAGARLEICERAHRVSTGRSDRTSRSSIRLRATGPSSRRPG